MKKIKKCLYFMYILQNGDTNQYKIGITGNLNQRMKSIQTGCPGELKIVKIYTNKSKSQIMKYERVLHRYYEKAGCRLRANGEWFELRQPDIAFLCKPQTIAQQNQLIAEVLKMM